MSKSEFNAFAVGTRMAVEVIHRAFNELALSHAAADRESALAALGRIELLIADRLQEFRQWSGAEIADYNDVFDAMIMSVDTLVQGAREAIERGSGVPEE